MNDTYSATKICLENWVNQAQLANPYLILMVYDGDLAGALVDAGTGIPAADTTWANAAFDESHFTAHAVTGYPVFTIPQLNDKYRYRILLFDGASPANSDTVYDSGFYDPQTHCIYGNSVPVQENRVRIR